jgi:hypothetical protein
MLFISHNLETGESGFCSASFLSKTESFSPHLNVEHPQRKTIAIITDFLFKMVLKITVWIYESILLLGRKMVKSRHVMDRLPSLQSDHIAWTLMWIRRIALIGLAAQFTAFALYTLLDGLMIVWNKIQLSLSATRDTWLYVIHGIQYVAIDLLEIGRIPVLFGNLLIFAAALAFLGELLLRRH